MCVCVYIYGVCVYIYIYMVCECVDWQRFSSRISTRCQYKDRQAIPTKQAVHCVDVTQAHVCPCNTSVTECRMQYKCDGVQSSTLSEECNTSVTECIMQYKCDGVQRAIQV